MTAVNEKQEMFVRFVAISFLVWKQHQDEKWFTIFVMSSFLVPFGGSCRTNIVKLYFSEEFNYRLAGAVQVTSFG